MSQNMLLGCRVVRGPDWKWQDQDGGERCVGTIVNLTHFSNGKNLRPKSVLVCWDRGYAANYRAGSDGCYDLRIFDSAPAGVEFIAFTCDGCTQKNIAGMRWHCSQCHDYDLCTVCYMNDVHDTTHKFERFDQSNDRSNGVIVSPRSSATKVQSKGLFPGATVKKGRDWSLGDELSSMVGRVTGLTSFENVKRSAVIVKWGQSLEIPQRVGYQGKVDIYADQPDNGPYYYKEHLPVAVKSSRGEKQLNEEDRVTIHLDEDTLKQMSEGHGGWVVGKEKTIGCVGTISKIDKDGDVHVKFGSKNWVFSTEALVKVHDLRPNDKVRVIKDKELLMKYQEGHGGWNDAMESALGNQGTVIDVDKDGDAMVNVAGQSLFFNAAALVLESIEDEPHGIEQLVLASTSGDLDKVKELITKDKSLLNQTSNEHTTALHAACHQGNPEIVSFLLESGADEDIRDDKGYTALHHAAYGDKSGACVVIILSANANVNDMDNTKVTALHLAIQQDNKQAVVALTQVSHCNANLQDQAGNTPLHYAILMGQTQNAITILQNCHQRLDPTLFNQKGFNVLHLACLKDETKTAEILIDKYPGLVDMIKEDGFSALHLCALNNRCEIAKLLILSGHCSIDLQNKELGTTALSIAVGQSYKHMIELLLEHGVKINVEDKDGDTPLHMAVMKHCTTFLELSASNAQDENDDVDFAIALFLVLRGADVNHQNHQGKTPIDLCLDQKLKKMLIDYSRNPRVPGNAPPQRPSNPQTVPSRPSSTTPNTTPQFAAMPKVSSPITPSSNPTSPISLPPPPSDVKPPPLPPFPESISALIPPHKDLGICPTSPVSLPPPPSDVKPRTPPPPPESISALFPSFKHLKFFPKPSETKLGTADSVAGPTSREDVPPCLGQAENQEQNNENVNLGVTGKMSNNQVASVTIQASAQQPISQAQDSNQMCRCCQEEAAVILFQPCNHKVVCQTCSFRTRKCPQCQAIIENKVAPGEDPYRSLTDFKKNYEQQLKELKKKCDNLELLTQCQICMDKPSDHVFEFCGHRACEACSHRIRKCHICSRDITKDKKIKTFQ